MLTMYCST